MDRSDGRSIEVLPLEQSEMSMAAETGRVFFFFSGLNNSMPQTLIPARPAELVKFNTSYLEDPWT